MRQRVSWMWLLLASVVISMAFAVAAGAATGSFEDDEGSVHEPAIEALAGKGVLAGTECGEWLICPREEFRRWVMAIWLTRVLNKPLPGEASPRFDDVESDEWWAPYVEVLADIGVTRGCATDPPRYCPDKPVTRGQMATFLARAFHLESGAPAGFVDTVGNTHEASIDALAAVHVTAGCSANPPRQAASFRVEQRRDPRQ